MSKIEAQKQKRGIHEYSCFADPDKHSKDIISKMNVQKNCWFFPHQFKKASNVPLIHFLYIPIDQMNDCNILFSFLIKVQQLSRL